MRVMGAANAEGLCVLETPLGGGQAGVLGWAERDQQQHARAQRGRTAGAAQQARAREGGPRLRVRTVSSLWGAACSCCDASPSVQSVCGCGPQAPGTHQEGGGSQDHQAQWGLETSCP